MIKNYKRIVQLAIVLLLFGCHSVQKGHITPVPDNLIPKDKMTSILVDIQLIEASIKTDTYHRQNADYFTKYYYSYIFDKYKISQKNFEESLNYYQQNLEEFDAIFAV
jgi:hypothetical protein